MPKIITIHANPDFAQKSDAAYQEIKKRGPLKVEMVTALENIRLSEGRYAIQPEKRDEPTRIAVALEDMPLQDLKVMMLNLGIKTSKVMKKSEVISSIRKKLSSIDIVEDDAEGEE